MILGRFWKKFYDLLPKTPRLIGTIISVDGGGRYTVQLAGGGTLQVSGVGSFSLADKVFVVDKVIESLAPSLTTLTIEV